MITIEILNDTTMIPDTGTVNVPVRVVRFRVLGQVQEYEAQGRTLSELKASAIAAMKPKVYPTMEV